MRFLCISLLFIAAVSAQPIDANPPSIDAAAQSIDTASDTIREIVGRLDLEQYKAHVKGLAQFGDRKVGTPRNREAVDWLEEQLKGFGYKTVKRHSFPVYMRGTADNLYATKVGTTHPGQMYIVSAHLDGEGSGEAADDDASGCAVVLELARVLASPDIQTEYSVRFVFWNAEEAGLNGSFDYVKQRAPLQASGEEPEWLGVIQHDMVLYDHGIPPGPEQSPEADINIEYRYYSMRSGASARLAELLQAANKLYAQNYPAAIGPNMAGTDSMSFQDDAPSVSIRENEKRTGINRRSNPNYHRTTDTYDAYSEKDFQLGFDAARTTLGALGHLAGMEIRGSE